MTAQAENYKGIEFVRISTLPEDQKQMIWTSLKRDKIIKILKSDCLLNDCIQLHDYETWYRENYKTTVDLTTEASSSKLARKLEEFTLAFK
jgi:hypothetical protein